MEELSLKLDIYNLKVSNNLFNCQKDEKYCKSMISKLVFYDREEILQMHSDHMSNRNFIYDVSKLQKKDFLAPNEKVERIVPLESYWIAVFFSDKKSKELIPNKVMYISSEGDGYFSSNVEPALQGIVPEEIYYQYRRDNPNGLLLLDKRYLDGTHDEFLKKMNDISREKFEPLFASIMGIPGLKLEEIYPLIEAGYKNRDDEEAFERAKTLDFLYSHIRIQEIIDFDKKYYAKKSGSQPGESE